MFQQVNNKRLYNKELLNLFYTYPYKTFDMTKTWNGTINRTIHKMGKFHRKAFILI